MPPLLPTTTAKIKRSPDAINLSYGDLRAHLFLWQKALLLAPVWAVLIVPIVGVVCRLLGNSALQFGYGILLCMMVTYFFEDLLKRRIRMDGDYIYFGFRAVPIRNLVAVDIKYKKSKFLPGTLVLTESSGRVLKLRFDGLTAASVEALLKHLQSHNSTLKIAPVLTAMIKCRRVKPLPLETPERLEVTYQSRQLISESIEAFKLSLRKWLRMGPLLACILLGPVWMAFIAQLYVGMHSGWTSVDQLSLHQFLTQIFNGVQQFFFHFASKASEGFYNLAKISYIGIAAGVAILCVVGYLQRFLWRPNLLVADLKGLSLVMRLGRLVIPLSSVRWSQVTRMGMQTSGNTGGKLLIEKADGKKMKVELSSMTPEDKGVLLRRMEKLVPNCPIEHELSQSMLPNSDHSYTEIWLQSLNQSPERKTLEPLEPAQMVGESRFEVLQALGVGGQGTAYLCRHVFNKESPPVVLKETILPIFVDHSLRRRALEKFDQEAKLLKSLDHPGVVQLLDYFVEDHRAYLVLEHINGSNLRDVILKDGPMKEEQVRDLAIQMVDILKFLHEHGCVHRDFTPDNLILNSKGKLKLIDFNVAQQIESGTTGAIVGKHAYLPPEQFRGKATLQSDLYAFGATLFFLTTGKDPEPISQSSPLAKNASLSGEMDQIVKRSTALQTNNRYQTAQEIEVDLLALPDLTETIFTGIKEEAILHG